MRKFLLTTSAALLALAVGAGSAAAGGPPGVGFYVDDALYRTIGTPTDFSETGAPGHSFDTIYALGGDLLNVAETAPGDRDYNGGRWVVVPIIWHVDPVQFTSDAQILAAEAAGDIDLGAPVKYFECPAIKLQPNR